MLRALVLVAGAVAAVVRLVDPPEIVIKDGLVLPCTLNNVCVPDAGMLANHLSVIAFATVAAYLAIRQVERSRSSS